MQHLSRQLNKGFKMKTVGEFKKAGLVLVEGDVVDDSCDNDGTLMKPLSATMVGCCNDGKYQFNEAAIESFAWRENTGVKPDFSGLVETESFEGYKDSLYPKDIIWNHRYGGRLSIKKWRPSLNQPSVAEPDTKKSAIHKAWVELKGDLNNVIDDIQGSKDSILKCISGIGSFSIGDYAFCVGNYHNKSVWEYVCATQEFTDYCEKMAAEEKRIDIIGQNGNDGLHYGKAAQQVEALFANGMPKNMKFVPITGVKTKQLNPDNKPIFTQAMADAGELPPVGVKCIITPHNNLWGISRLDDYVGEVIYYEGETFVFKLDTKTLDSSSVFVSRTDKVDFKPIDTRTDREKAIDAALHEWPVADKATLEMAYDFWRVGDI